MSKKLLTKALALSMSAAMVMQPVSAFAAEEPAEELLLEEEEADFAEENEDLLATDEDAQISEEDADMLLDEGEDLMPQIDYYSPKATVSAVEDGIIREVAATADTGEILYKRTHKPATIIDDAGQVHFTFVQWEKMNEDGNWESIGASSDKELEMGKYRCKVIMELNDELKGDTALDSDIKLTVNGFDWDFFEISGYNGYAITSVVFYSPEYEIAENVPIKRGPGIPDDGNIKKGRWFDRYGATYYITADGKYLHGLHRVDGFIYFFNKSGAIKKNVVLTIDNQKYYFNKLGRMHFGLKKLNGATYYFKKGTGAMQYGFQTLSDVTGSPELFYFRPETGAMVKGQFETIGGAKYYFKKNGAAKKEFLTKWGATYYFDPDNCKMVEGFRTIGVTYYFRPGTGAMVKNSFETINGSIYYLKANGARAENEDIIKYEVKYHFGGDGRLEWTAKMKGR